MPGSRAISGDSGVLIISDASGSPRGDPPRPAATPGCGYYVPAATWARQAGELKWERGFLGNPESCVIGPKRWCGRREEGGGGGVGWGEKTGQALVARYRVLAAQYGKTVGSDSEGVGLSKGGGRRPQSGFRPPLTRSLRLWIPAATAENGDPYIFR